MKQTRHEPHRNLKLTADRTELQKERRRVSRRAIAPLGGRVMAHCEMRYLHVSRR